MKKTALLAVVLAAACVSHAHAQAPIARVVTACGGSSFPTGTVAELQMTSDGKLCTNAVSTGGTTSIAPLTGTGIYSGATVGTADGTVSAGAHTNYLELINASNTATICVNFGATATISGTQCAAGEIPLPPLGFHSWGVAEGVVPQDAIHAICSAAACQLTVGVK